MSLSRPMYLPHVTVLSYVPHVTVVSYCMYHMSLSRHMYHMSLSCHMYHMSLSRHMYHMSLSRHMYHTSLSRHMYHMSLSRPMYHMTWLTCSSSPTACCRCPVTTAAPPCRPLSPAAPALHRSSGPLSRQHRGPYWVDGRGGMRWKGGKRRGGMRWK